MRMKKDRNRNNPHWKPIFDKATDLLLTMARKSDILKKDIEFQKMFISKGNWIKDRVEDLSELDRFELDAAIEEWKKGFPKEFPQDGKKVLDGDV